MTAHDTGRVLAALWGKQKASLDYTLARSTAWEHTVQGYYRYLGSWPNNIGQYVFLITSIHTSEFNTGFGREKSEGVEFAKGEMGEDRNPLNFSLPRLDLHTLAIGHITSLSVVDTTAMRVAILAKETYQCCCQ